jgi:hypothetical protein
VVVVDLGILGILDGDRDGDGDGGTKADLEGVLMFDSHFLSTIPHVCLAPVMHQSSRLPRTCHAQIPDMPIGSYQTLFYRISNQ